ncbi:organelle RRM domain-containing protein 1, chloroplastic-like isoform X2 [Salvia hispanica]|uniref:organelle RRM domain-containing protein 1, chloroplastic-like isoform X2 n=1 Tax=Salvia hispanica TaxID=49212 RepID=UPI0020092CDF|nr:organelle RRM domain-containing protein 1, chloroplastic-like isoform X2 [Salvia hispanica]XP_047971540.1 organelle RRM domain-containing protein 1, chloroplastic-like isoform X2 [Salvia hispanica]
MEAQLSSLAAFPPIFAKPSTIPHCNISFPARTTSRDLTSPNSTFPFFTSTIIRAQIASTTSSSTTHSGKFSTRRDNQHWMVVVEAPPPELIARSQIIDYYVSKVRSVLESEKDAQRCIYDASCDTHFGFCCDIDEQRANELASVPGVLSVKPDPDVDSTQKDYSYPSIELSTDSTPLLGSTLLFPAGTTKQWLVRMERPAIGAIRKAQVVDYYVQVLMRVLRNESDAQMCIYHISWQSSFGFCCELDDECARELADVPGVLSIQPDKNFGSDDKDYAGKNTGASENSSASTLANNIRTKKLFVTGLSFYTSEKTLRAAFEGFGQLVQVRIIMDKISKRSKGYAFVEYTTEEAASTALREMNGKIINGWMITVDVAKTNPPKFSMSQTGATAAS